MKRKVRSTLMKKNLDLSKPLTYELVGTDDDPCFGKHYDSMALECQRCGDSEFCIIAKSHNLKVKRLKLESKESFKDMEEETIQSARVYNRDQLVVKVKNRIKKADVHGISIARLATRLTSKYGLTNDEAIRIIDITIAKYNRIRKKDGKLFFTN